jgi:hypothetical protein
VKRCYSEDDPEVIDIETGYKDNNIEEDVVERPRNRGRKAVPPLHAQGRVGGSVYEVYQVQPRSTMQRDVLIKNDSGAQITFIAPDLYEFGIKEGFIKNEREFETEEMLGIGGSTFINIIADMEVCIEGSLIAVTIQVVPNKAIEDRNFQILLGTDNTEHMGRNILPTLS